MQNVPQPRTGDAEGAFKNAECMSRSSLFPKWDALAEEDSFELLNVLSEPNAPNYPNGQHNRTWDECRGSDNEKANADRIGRPAVVVVLGESRNGGNNCGGPKDCEHDWRGESVLGAVNLQLSQPCHLHHLLNGEARGELHADRRIGRDGTAADFVNLIELDDVGCAVVSSEQITSLCFVQDLARMSGTVLRDDDISESSRSKKDRHKQESAHPSILSLPPAGSLLAANAGAEVSQ